MTNRKTLIQKIFNIFVNTVMYGVLTAIIIMFIIVLFYSSSDKEAFIGNFDIYDFNDDWLVEFEGESMSVSLPYTVMGANDKDIVISNILPDYVNDGMTIAFRGSMEKMKVFVEGELREEYDSDDLNSSKKNYVPSAYLFTELTKEDAGKEIKVYIHSDNDKGTLNKVSVGYASNIWYQVTRENTILLLAAVIISFFGLAAVVACIFIHKYFNNIKQLLYIGLLMFDTGLWIISESKIRQLYMKSPSLSLVLSIWLISLVGIFAGIYFDYIEKKRHHEIFLGIETVMALQIVINTVLHFLGIADIHDTLIFSHIWMAVGLVLCLGTIVYDTVKGWIKEYKISSVGMGIFGFMAFFEIIKYYKNPQGSFGIFVAGGMMVVLLTTILQTIVDEIMIFTDKEETIKKQSLMTIETIMSSVDAKDEYTGGHSERVADYVEALAKAVSSDYNFTDEDIERIKNIGLLHDIGKIGIPDRILNKAGKLTLDEYTLMKRHTIIGDDLLSSFGEIDGLADGIRHHHERYDGTGYPDSISGNEISVIARIICLADCYDAMTSNRVYRKRLSEKEVIEEIQKCSGTQFDPFLADKFCELIKEGKLNEATKDGLAVDDKGNYLCSAKLENILNEDLASKDEFVTNPSFVRMVCYLIKKAEKNDVNVDVKFINVKSKNDNKVSREILSKKMVDAYSKKTEGQDIAIQYKSDSILLAFFDRTETEAAKYIDRIVKDLNIDSKEIEIISLNNIQ